MTDAQLKKLAEENHIKPTYELLTFARLVLINAKIEDLKSVAHNSRLVVQKEREAILETIEELMGSETRHPMFSEGYDYALYHLNEFIKARREK